MAQRSLTAEFGMGSGWGSSPWPPGRRSTHEIDTGFVVACAAGWLRCPRGLPDPSFGMVRQARRGAGPDGPFLVSGQRPVRLWRTGRTLINESDQADRAIRTAQLHPLPGFHMRPINVVVYHGSQGRPGFEVGFPLRCFQRLSRPHIATLHCGWRHNRSTRGVSIPVLSY